MLAHPATTLNENLGVFEMASVEEFDFTEKSFLILTI